MKGKDLADFMMQHIYDNDLRASDALCACGLVAGLFIDSHHPEERSEVREQFLWMLDCALAKAAERRDAADAGVEKAPSYQ
jgi:hypothetical protein